MGWRSACAAFVVQLKLPAFAIHTRKAGDLSRASLRSPPSPSLAKPTHPHTREEGETVRACTAAPERGRSHATACKYSGCQRGNRARLSVSPMPASSSAPEGSGSGATHRDHERVHPHTTPPPTWVCPALSAGPGVRARPCVLLLLLLHTTCTCTCTTCTCTCHLDVSSSCSQSRLCIRDVADRHGGRCRPCL